MLKIPKGLKKKKKGKKSKGKKGEEELFTEAELEKYRREHQQQAESSEGQVKENEEWSKFKDLTTGVDSILKKTQGDLDRIKSTSFFQRIPSGPKQVDSLGRVVPEREKPPPPPQQEVSTASAATSKKEPEEEEDKSEYAVTDTESEEEDQDDIFDTSFVEAVERGECKLAYVPDSPDDFKDDGLFDTSYVDSIIKGQEAKAKETRGKKALNIGVAVEVLTGRIDNVTITSRRSKRVIPGDFIFDSVEDATVLGTKVVDEPTEKSILDVDSDIPINTPIDLSVSLHTHLIKQQEPKLEDAGLNTLNDGIVLYEEEDDEFSRLAAESLETTTEVIKLDKETIVQPVLQEAWSAFEANKNENVFAESIVEDQIDVDPFIDQTSDPFDTSFADTIIPPSKVVAPTVDDDDDFDPRAEEVSSAINNRRKSTVHIHLTDPSGIRESITSEDLQDHVEEKLPRDLLGGSSTDLTQLGDCPLDPVDINETEFSDPFDTTIVDKIVAPGKQELKFLERELIGNTPTICRSPSDPDFDPRADEPKQVSQRRPSRPENLIVSKNVVFDIENSTNNALDVESKGKSNKPLTPYYTREVSITEDIDEEDEAVDKFSESLPRSLSNQDLANIISYQKKRRHSEYPSSARVKIDTKPIDLLGSDQTEIRTKVLTPSELETQEVASEIDPFDTTSFAESIQPSKTELKLLAKEFSCEDTTEESVFADKSLLGPTEDNIFQAKALTPEPTRNPSFPDEDDIDPFDTSFATNLQPGRTEIKLLESEFLN